MNINTHKNINQKICGKPVLLKKNYCKLLLETNDKMISDEFGLVHGGFIFGAADYAAMLALNHPNVVLGSSSVKFLKPVSVGQSVDIEAELKEIKGKKFYVTVTASVNDNNIFEGEFICFVLEKHILAAK